ncbi:LOW QUALITY PROTEIN: uncharacterized protein [Phyllobates terribilis]|uniref:LOW QUALITY PROTEIN: uncharacterized protein n=1 Tax=Phyllobates terribilis TaxID=111132 RepID=UPI003CCAD3EE
MIKKVDYLPQINAVVLPENKMILKMKDLIFDVLVEKSEPSVVVPDSETPKGLYFLSNLDQNIGMVVSTLYCFKAKDKGNEDAARVMKESLARVLVHYYPLAGRLRAGSEGKLVVECTAQGALFVEAQADCAMDDIANHMMDHDPTVRAKLVYDFYLDKPKSVLDIPLVMAQVTKLNCGGFILGLTLNHALLDGVGATAFVKAWGEVARGLPLKKPPFHDRTLLRARSPPRIEFSHPEFEEMPPLEEEEEEIERKTFTLDAKSIERLKYKAMEDGFLDRCTSFEVLTAFAWRARTTALRTRYDDTKPCKLVFPVDGRPRFRPPLPEGYVGNAIVMASCECSEGELAKSPFSHAVSRVQRAIEGITDSFMRSAIDYYEVTRARPSMRSVLLVTTWARLSFYQTDFGWGDPLHSGPVGFPGKEVVMILANGGESKMSTTMLVALPAPAMNRFEQMLQDI